MGAELARAELDFRPVAPTIENLIRGRGCRFRSLTDPYFTEPPIRIGYHVGLVHYSDEVLLVSGACSITGLSVLIHLDINVLIFPDFNMSRIDAGCR